MSVAPLRPPRPAGPPLVPGERLTRDEFLRRWAARPDLKFAELIGGVVYMPSPLSVPHGTMDSLANLWLSMYAASTPGCEAAVNTTWHMLNDAPQPDSCLRRPSACGGASRVVDDFYHGVPELIVEVCRTTTAYDLHAKLDLYATAGVPEVIAIVLEDQSVRWHRLEAGRYHRAAPQPDGTLRSTTFPGLWLDTTALLARDAPGVLATLQRGLATPEHAAFVTELARRRAGQRE